MTEAQLPQAQVLGELVMEPLNKALQEENGNLKAENRVLKEREICKQELMDEYKAKVKNAEEENQRAKDENQKGKEEVQRFKDEISSMKEKEIRLSVENEFLKRREEQLRLENEYLKRKEEEWRLERNTERAERTADRAMFQVMMSNLMNRIDDRKRKRNDDDELM